MQLNAELNVQSHTPDSGRKFHFFLYIEKETFTQLDTDSIFQKTPKNFSKTVAFLKIMFRLLGVSHIAANLYCICVRSACFMFV